uniref:Uncharacterized protein n=1 Tax=Sphaerodactylus townsendi TaxID=933632 RepID=A0ACB8FKG5_9SAUR
MATPASALASDSSFRRHREPGWGACSGGRFQRGFCCCILQKKKKKMEGVGEERERETEMDWSRVKNPVFIIIINNQDINNKNGIALVDVGPVHSGHIVV